MKTRLIFCLVPVFILGCLASRKIQYDEPRKVAKQKLVPPGTVWLRDSTFIDICEVRNLDYLEFLFNIRNDKERYTSMLPDTLCWRTIYPDSIALPFVYYYLRHPSYRDFPVVGVSYSQALAYCTWRSLMVNRFLFIQTHGGWKAFTADSINNLNPPEYVTYSLPTKEEWEYAAAAGLDYAKDPLGYQSILDKRNLPVSNTAELRNALIHSGMIRYKSKGKSIWLERNPTQVVYSGQPNCYAVYNMLGNVSEMIDDSCFKGLNYETTLDGSTFKLKPDSYQLVDSTKNSYDYKYTFRYTRPQPWLGLRCVCNVHQLP